MLRIPLIGHSRMCEVCIGEEVYMRVLCLLCWYVRMNGRMCAKVTGCATVSRRRRVMFIVAMRP